MEQAFTFLEIFGIVLVLTPIVFIPEIMEYNRVNKIHRDALYWANIKETRHKIKG